MLKQLGVLCWYDMEQPELTLEGMKQGVRDSQHFLLIMSESVLMRWFCQQEILEAIRQGKPIILLAEVDGRFFPFDLDAWVRGDASVRDFRCDTPEDHTAICAAIDEAIAAGRVVIYRRRDFEARAMNHRLCLLAGLPLPQSVITGSSQPSDSTCRERRPTARSQPRATEIV